VRRTRHPHRHRSGPPRREAPGRAGALTERRWKFLSSTGNRCPGHGGVGAGNTSKSGGSPVSGSVGSKASKHAPRAMAPGVARRRRQPAPVPRLAKRASATPWHQGALSHAHKDCRLARDQVKHVSNDWNIACRRGAEQASSKRSSATAAAAQQKRKPSQRQQRARTSSTHRGQSRQRFW
jgi:hypothetical protein